MTAMTTNTGTSTHTQDDAGVPPAPPEALRQAGAALVLPLTLRHPATGITAYLPPLAPGAKAVVVQLSLAPKLPRDFVATFATLPSAVDYMLAAGYEVCDPPAGRVRISDFREAVDFLNWVRADIAGATPAEFLRMDVRGRITKAVAALARLRPGVPARFVEDLDGADGCVARAMECVTRWEALRATGAERH